MQLKRTMVVVRLSDGRLLLHSAIAMAEPDMMQLEELGQPSFLIVPSAYHRLDAARYKDRYPEIEVLCPSGGQSGVEKVVAVDRCYEDCPEFIPGDDAVRLTYYDEGGPHIEGILLVRSSDGLTAVFNDTLFNIPNQKGLFWFLYGRVLGASGGPKVTPLGRLILLRGKARSGFKNWLHRAADENKLVRVVPGHGDILRADIASVFRELAASL